MDSETGSEASEEGPAFLQLENAFLLQLLQRVSPQVLADAPHGTGAGARGPAATGANALRLAERQELCAVEADVTRRETETVVRAGELELACTLAAIADCQQQQAAQTSRDQAALLALLRLPAVPAAGSGSPAASAAVSMPAVCEKQTDALSVAATTATGAEPDGEAGAGRRLPAAKQLVRAEFSGARLGQYLEGILERHDAAAARLQIRAAMLEVSLAGWLAGLLGIGWLVGCWEGRQHQRPGAGMGAQYTHPPPCACSPSWSGWRASWRPRQRWGTL